jgi:hypothetical protein
MTDKGETKDFKIIITKEMFGLKQISCPELCSSAGQVARAASTSPIHQPQLVGPATPAISDRTS